VHPLTADQIVHLLLGNELGLFEELHSGDDLISSHQFWHPFAVQGGHAGHLFFELSAFDGIHRVLLVGLFKALTLDMDTLVDG